MIEEEFDEDRNELNEDNFLSMKEFSRLIGREPQTLSFHLKKGRLKPYVEEGIKLFKRNGEYLIHRDLLSEFEPKIIQNLPKQFERSSLSGQSINDKYEELREELMESKIEAAELRGRLGKIEEMERTIQALQEALAQAKSATEALNNERLVITQQLQKYRQEDKQETKKSTWKFWK